MLVLLYKESADDFYDKYGPTSKGNVGHTTNINLKDIKKGKPVTWVDDEGNEITSEDVGLLVQFAIEKLINAFPTSIGKAIIKKPVIITDNPKIRTFATDGFNIFVSPFFVIRIMTTPKFNDEDDVIDAIAYVMAHEALHIIFRHVYEERMAKDYMNHGKCNATQDCQINLYIETVLSKAFPNFVGMTNTLGGIIDNKYVNKHWKEIYDELPDNHRWLNKPPKRTSASFKEGFSAGYNYVMNALRKNKLIESYGI